MTLHQKLKKLKNTRLYYKCLVALGLGASAFGNTLNAKDTGVAVAIALLPPILFFLAFEAITKLPLRKETHWAWKVLLILAVVAIVAIMAYLSYHHQRAAVHRVTQDVDTANLLPAAIDAFMLVFSVLLVEVGIQIRDVEARMSVTPKVTEDVPPAPKERQPSGKERVAMLLAKYPEITLRDLHQQAGVSLSYATSVAKQVRALHQQPA